VRGQEAQVVVRLIAGMGLFKAGQQLHDFAGAVP
jgi:hypothetical protein